MDERDATFILRVRVRRLNALASGTVAGLLAGGGLFLATNWLLLKGGHPVGPHLSLLGQFFVGYHVSLGGSFVGLVWGFLTGFLTFASGAWLYNRIAETRAARRRGER